MGRESARVWGPGAGRWVGWRMNGRAGEGWWAGEWQCWVGGWAVVLGGR